MLRYYIRCTIIQLAISMYNCAVKGTSTFHQTIKSHLKPTKTAESEPNNLWNTATTPLGQVGHSSTPLKSDSAQKKGIPTQDDTRNRHSACLNSFLRIPAVQIIHMRTLVPTTQQTPRSSALQLRAGGRHGVPRESRFSKVSSRLAFHIADGASLLKEFENYRIETRK